MDIKKQVKTQSVTNGMAIRIPAEIVKLLGLQKNQSATIEADRSENKIIITF